MGRAAVGRNVILAKVVVLGRAVLPGAFAAIGTIASLNHIGGFFDGSLFREILVGCIHNRTEHRNTGVGGNGDFLGDVIAVPDCRRILRGKAHEPAVLVLGGGTGFTGSKDTV